MANGSDDRKLHELVVLEYKYITDQFLKNEEMGEKRVALFVSLTAGLGAAAIIAKEKIGPLGTVSFPEVFLLVTAAWFLIGHLTFLRIVNRNKATDKLKGQLDVLRQWFVEEGDAAARRILPYNPYAEMVPRSELRLFSGRGGYAELVALINSFIVGTFAWQISRIIANVIGCVTSLVQNSWLLRFLLLGIALLVVWRAWKWYVGRTQELYSSPVKGSDAIC